MGGDGDGIHLARKESSYQGTLIKLFHDGEPAKMSADPTILPYQ
jgi:hypothetical protein